MKEKPNRKIVGLLIAATLLMAFMPNLAYATGGLELEKSKEWVTGSYSYSNANAVGDVDGDGVTEIVTAGYFYNSTLGLNEGEVNIWNCSGTDINEEHKEIIDPVYTWSSDTRFYSVALGNVDNETDTEIVVAGYGRLMGIIEQGMLIVLGWNGTTMERKTVMYWPLEFNETKFFDVAIGDVDEDGVTEIVAVGYRNTTSILGTGLYGALTIWNVTDTALKLETNAEWLISGDTEWHGVTIDDVDGDGDIEILVTGYFYDKTLDHECATLRICTWDGSALTWEASSQWYTYLDTNAVDIATGDLDSDGTREIVTVGRQFNGENYYAQLRIWSWDGNSLTLRLSTEGGLVGLFASTSDKTLTISDIDKDGTNEIIVGVDKSQFLFYRSIVRVLSWDGRMLTTKDSKEWTNATNIECISAGDVDADGTIEIITSGYYWPILGIGTKSELAVWSVSKVASSITVTVSSPSIVIGHQVIISGRVTNETGDTPIPNVEVTIESSYEPLPVFTTIGKVLTNENGEYTFTWTPPVAGNYIIRASWKGDYEHEAADATVTLTVEKASSMIVLTLSSYTATVGESISVTGTLNPAKTATITLQYTSPNGSISTKTVNSDDAGMFSDTFTASQAGKWQIKAMWNGDEQYKAAESATITLTAQTIDTMTPMFAIGGLGLGVIALVLAAMALYMSSKKTKAQPTPPATAPPQA